MQQSLVLEVCAFNAASCIIAERAGAHRIELCADHKVGGITPYMELVREVKEKLAIPVYPIIRPRGGDFLYTDEEFELMLTQIQECKALQCEGIATGVHLQNGEIDKQRLQQLVSAAYPMKVTCHRVFDRTPNPFEALENIIECGCERILTSGQKHNAAEAISLLNDLVEAAGNRIIIMPGGGVRADNIEALITGTGASEFHTSARIPNTEDVDENELIQILQVMKVR